MYVIARPLVAVGAAAMAAAAVAGPVAQSAPPPGATGIAMAVELAALPSWLGWVDDGTALVTAQIAAIANGLVNEIGDPLPIAATVLRNQFFNAQDLGSALVTSAQVVLSGLVSVPDLLLNAVFDAVANPLSIPAVLTGLVADLIGTAGAAVAPLGSALTSLFEDTVTRAVGAFNAIVGGSAPIGAALINLPLAIGGAVVDATLGVVGSLATLNPLNVISAAGDGLVDIEAATFNAVASVAAAAGNLRSNVRAALAYPLPAAAAAPAGASPPDGFVESGSAQGVAVTEAPAAATSVNLEVALEVAQPPTISEPAAVRVQRDATAARPSAGADGRADRTVRDTAGQRSAVAGGVAPRAEAAAQRQSRR